MTQTQAKTHLPIALVGGGLTTQVLALTLVHCGFEFVWFSGPPATRPAGADTRTTTIHHAGKVMLEALGIWDGLADPAYPITEIAVAGQRAQTSPTRQTARGTMRRAMSWPLRWQQDSPPMAYVVSNQVLTMACEKLIQDQLSEAQIKPVLIEELVLGQPNTLQDSQQQTWTCDLVIACDGANSRLRTQAGLRAVDHSRNETALVTTVTTEKPIGTAAYQRFLPSGPLALMPTGPRAASVVWSLPAGKADEISHLDKTGFEGAINQAFGPELGWLTQSAPCLHWPLKPSYCPKISTGGFVLAGDAAHALHPLAGMGFNLALSDGAVLLDCLQTAAKAGLTPGHISVSAAYQARRKPEILALTTATQGLNRLLTRSQDPVYQLACVGMSVLGQLPARRLLSELAMGGRLSPAPLFDGHLQQPAR